MLASRPLSIISQFTGSVPDSVTLTQICVRAFCYSVILDCVILSEAKNLKQEDGTCHSERSEESDKGKEYELCTGHRVYAAGNDAGGERERICQSQSACRGGDSHGWPCDRRRLAQEVRLSSCGEGGPGSLYGGPCRKHDVCHSGTVLPLRQAASLY